MALYHKWDLKSGFAFVLQFFSLLSDCLDGVKFIYQIGILEIKRRGWFDYKLNLSVYLIKALQQDQKKMNASKYTPRRIDPS